jgi:hypothetical protein
MFTRKNKGDDITRNKKTRKDKDSKSNEQKGGGGFTADVPSRGGVNNIGNTCYLNSLYQLLFSIDSFSNFILQFSNERIDSVLSREQMKLLFDFYTESLKSNYNDRAINNPNSNYNKAKQLFVKETIYNRYFGPIYQYKLLCVLLYKIFNKINDSNAEKLTYEPIIIPLILFPLDDPFDKQQDSSEALTALINKIPQLSSFIGFKTDTTNTVNTTKKIDDSNLIIINSNNGNKSVSTHIITDMTQKSNDNAIPNKKITYSKSKDYIVVYCIRNKDPFATGTYVPDNTKLKTQITIDDITIDAKKYKCHGIIYHSGGATTGGHYYFYDMSTPSDIRKFNDGAPAQKKQLLTDDIYQNWAMLLYKTTAQSNANQLPHDLIKFINEEKKDCFLFTMNDNVNNMDDMLKSDKELVNCKYGDTQMTALMYQTRHGTKDAMEFLINNGANVNDTDTSGRSALFYAINRDKIDSSKIKYLSEQPDIKLDVTASDGDTPLNYFTTIITTINLDFSKIIANEITGYLTKPAELTEAGKLTPLNKKYFYYFGYDFGIPYFTNYRNRRLPSRVFSYDNAHYIYQNVPNKKTNNDDNNLVFLPQFWKTKKIIYKNFGFNGELRIYTKNGDEYKEILTPTNEYNKKKNYSVHDDGGDDNGKIGKVLSDSMEVPITIETNDKLFVTFKWTNDQQNEKFLELEKPEETFYGIYDFGNTSQDKIITEIKDFKKIVESTSVPNVEPTSVPKVEPKLKFDSSKSLATYTKPDKTQLKLNIDDNFLVEIRTEVGLIDTDVLKIETVETDKIKCKLTNSNKDFILNEQNITSFDNVIDENKITNEDLKTFTKDLHTFTKDATKPKHVEIMDPATFNNLKKSEEEMEKTILAIPKIEDSLIKAANTAIETQKKSQIELISSSSNVENSFKEAANTAIKSEPISLKKVEIESKPNSTSNNITDSLITAANTAIKSEPISTSNNITDSLMTVANVAIESQTKSVIESITPSSNVENSFKEAANKSIQSQKDSLIKAEDSSKEAANELTVPQPTQSIKTYIIKFDATGNVKIVTEKVQPSGQSLSHEIEDHYFKGKKEYNPTESSQYTVTVKTDPITSKTNIEI